MAILLFPSTLLGVILCLVFLSARRLKRVGAGEELAHALALERRRESSPDRRRERRTAVNGSATAAILGSSTEDSIDCRIVNISRSGMRIAILQPVPMGAQVNVAWDKEFFIGTVCYSAADRDERGEHVIGLRLISSNH